MSSPSLKLIEWEDAYGGNHEWFRLDTLPAEIEPLIVRTVGFEVQRNADRVTLAMSLAKEGRDACDLFTIPVGMIRSEKVLR